MSKADEKLDKLGYIKNKSECYSEEKGVLLYEKPYICKKLGKHFCSDILTITFKNKKVVVCDLTNVALKMDKDLLNAIIEKMQELGW